MTMRLKRRRFDGRSSTWSDTARRCSWDEVVALDLPSLELSVAGLETGRVARGRGEAPCGRIALVDAADCHSAIASRVTSLAGICSERASEYGCGGVSREGRGAATYPRLAVRLASVGICAFPVDQILQATVLSSLV